MIAQQDALSPTRACNAISGARVGFWGIESLALVVQWEWEGYRFGDNEYDAIVVGARARARRRRCCCTQGP